MFAVSFCVYLALKFLFVTGRVAQGHYLLFAVDAFLVYVIARLAAASSVNKFLDAHALMCKPLEWIGARTLEIYVLQGFLVYRDDIAHCFGFPLNLVSLFLVLALAAWLCHSVVALVVRQRRDSPAIA